MFAGRHIHYKYRKTATWAIGPRSRFFFVWHKFVPNKEKCGKPLVFRELPVNKNAFVSF